MTPLGNSVFILLSSVKHVNNLVIIIHTTKSLNAGHLPLHTNPWVTTAAGYWGIKPRRVGR